MLQLNRAKFSANGNCGYVLKPQCMCQGEAQGPRVGRAGAAAAGNTAPQDAGRRGVLEGPTPPGPGWG